MFKVQSRRLPLAYVLAAAVVTSGGAGCGDDVEPPAAPTGLEVTAQPGTIEVSWTDASDDETGFLVLREAVAEDAPPSDEPAYEELASIPADSTAYLDGTVEPGTSYRYGVAALRDGARSPVLGPSEVIAATAVGVDIVDPNDPVGVALNNLGVDTSTTPRIDEAGEPLEPDYAPLGASVVLDRRDELLVVGPNLSNLEPQRVVEVDDEGAPASLSTEPFADYASDIHDVPHAAAAGDFDGDGLEEYALVYVGLDAGGEQSELRLRYLDDALAELRETTFEIGDASGITRLNLVAGDFNGDGVDGLALGMGGEGRATLSFHAGEGEGFSVLDTFVFEATANDVSVWLRLAAGNVDNDTPEELGVVINESSTQSGDPVVSRWAVLDDANDDYAELGSDFVQGQDGSVFSALVADIAFGDVDDDGRNEVVLGGLTALVNTCANESILSIVLDDAMPGNDLATLGVRQRIISKGAACSGADPTVLRFVHAVAGNLDDDGGDEFMVAQLVYDDWSNPWVELGFVDPLQVFGSSSGATLDDRNSAVTLADTDGDGRREIYALAPLTPRLRPYGVQVSGDDVSIELLDPTGWRIVGRDYEDRPLIVAANLDDDSIVAKLGAGTGDPTHQVVYTEPVILAVMAAAPCYSSGSQNISACSTSYGTGTGGGVTRERSISVKVGVSFGAKAIGGAATQSELKASVTFSAERTFGFGASYQLDKSVVFTSGPLEDAVIFTTIPYDIYRYVIVQHRDPSKIGQIEEIWMPREPVTLMVERKYFNRSMGPEAFQIDGRVLSHTPGDPSSYLSRAARDQLVRSLGFIDAIGELQTDSVSVGQGTGQITTSIDVSREFSASTALAISAEYELEGVAASVLTGFSVGVTGERSLTLSAGNSTSYGSSVGNIADPTEFASRGYDYGLFTYRYDAPSGRQFHVVNYWVE